MGKFDFVFKAECVDTLATSGSACLLLASPFLLESGVCRGT